MKKLFTTLIVLLVPSLALAQNVQVTTRTQSDAQKTVMATMYVSGTQTFGIDLGITNHSLTYSVPVSVTGITVTFTVSTDGGSTFQTTCGTAKTTLGTAAITCSGSYNYGKITLSMTGSGAFDATYIGSTSSSALSTDGLAASGYIAYWSSSTRLVGDSGFTYAAGTGADLAASDYLNFGASTGSGGYGFRDNAGTMEFKNSGGSWTGVGAGGGGSITGAGTAGYVTYWTTSSNISADAGAQYDAVNDQFKMANGTLANPSYSFVTSSSTGFAWNVSSGGQIVTVIAGSAVLAVDNAPSVRMISSGELQWSSGDPTALSGDVKLARDGAAILALRNGANAQEFRAYNTYTSAATNEMLRVSWSGNVANIYTDKSGTGTQRALRLGAGGLTEWNIETAGHLTPILHNTYNLGDATHYLANGYIIGMNVSTLTGTSSTITTMNGSVLNVTGANASGAVAVGGVTSSSTGNYRSTNNPTGGVLSARDAANGSDLALVTLNASNNAVFGNGTGTVTFAGTNATFNGSITPGTNGVVPRITAAADATSITPNSDSADVTTQANTQSAGTLTINADGGTPVNGRRWILRIKSTNVQTFSWNAQFRGALPTATSGGSNTDYYGFIYNSADSKWDITGNSGAPPCDTANLAQGTTTFTTATSGSVVAAAGASTKNYVYSAQVSNTGSTNVLITWRDGSGGSVLGYTTAPAGYGTTSIQFLAPLVTTANTALYAQTDAASTTVYVSAQACKGP